jgi:hypothetical protein
MSKHLWKESYNSQMTRIVWVCREEDLNGKQIGGCGAIFSMNKNDCDFQSPDEDEELLERHKINRDCDVHLVSRIMEK